MDDPRPTVRCIVCWWSDKKATPIVQPRGDTKGLDGRRNVLDAAFTLEQAAHFSEMGFEVIVDPFDMEALTRWRQLHEPPERKTKFFRRGE